MQELSGKIAAVTGSASGIGKATAVLLAKEGCHCAISDIDEKGLFETAQEIESSGVRVHSTKLDVSNREAVYRWADEIVGEFGKINIVVNNAGVELSAFIDEMTYEDLEWLLGISFYGMVYGTKAFLPYLRRAEAGHIVNISSVFGILAIPSQSAYTAAKFAIKGFTECLREELEIDGSKVSATVVHPGGVKTNIFRDTRIGMPRYSEYGIDGNILARVSEKLLLSTPEKAARKIVEGIKKNKRRVLVGPDAYAVDFMQRFFPTRYQKLMVSQYKLLEKKLKKEAGKCPVSW